MKPIHPLPLLGAILLAGCDAGTQASTSSETQTALQELADNAGAVASKLSDPERSTSTAARTSRGLGAPVRSSWDSAQCAGSTTGLYSGFGEIYRQSQGPGSGPDGTASTCSLLDSRHDYREFRLDSTGRWTFAGSWRQQDTLHVQLYDGTGSWNLRSGLSLSYLRLVSYLSPRLDTFHHTIQIRGICLVDLRMRDTLADSGMVYSDVDAPVVCGGRTVGRFLWDRIGTPRVVDLAGKIVTPRPRTRSSFPEDELGLKADLIDAHSGPADSTSVLRLVVRWTLLSGDSIAPGSRFSLLALPDGSMLDSAMAPHGSGDTLSFRIPRDATPDSASILTWFPHGAGGAATRFAIPR